MITINDINHPGIKEFISLRDKSLRNDNLVIIESDKVFKRILPLGVKIHKLFCTKSYYERNLDFINCYIKNKESVFLSTREMMKEIVGYRVHQGVMALTDRPKSVDIDKLKSPYLIINGITSQENIGTILRNACAFGIESVIIDSDSCTPWHKRCIRVSLGNVFNLNLHYTNNLVKTIETLKEKNIEIIGTTVNHSNIELQNCKFNSNIAIILGSEGYGIYRPVREMCDKLLTIPIKNNVSSINVASASSILFNRIYEQFTS